MTHIRVISSTGKSWSRQNMVWLFFWAEWWAQAFKVDGACLGQRWRASYIRTSFFLLQKNIRKMKDLLWFLLMTWILMSNEHSSGNCTCLCHSLLRLMIRWVVHSSNIKENLQSFWETEHSFMKLCTHNEGHFSWQMKNPKPWNILTIVLAKHKNIIWFKIYTFYPGLWKVQAVFVVW